MLSKAPLRGWPAVQALAFIAAVVFAYTGARVLDASRPSVNPALSNFDQAMPWLGLALLSTLLVAWRPRLPSTPPRDWPAAAAAFVRAHRVEIALFLLIFAFGVFMRVYRFGSSLPPSDGLCCEENINGGVAYRVLEGQRPLAFLLGRWGSAAGMLIFGYDTTGLRFFFPVMAIVTLVFLYLLLRQLASVPAALFGLALYAAAWWPSLRARQATEGTIETVLFSLLLVVAMRKRSAAAALGAGVLAGLISYEYEAFKVVPFVAAGFACAAALREVALRRPFQIDVARQRARELWRIAWRPVLVFLMGAGIVVIPIIIGEQHGHDVYLASVHRNEGGEGDRLRDNWWKQTKWAAEVFLPAGQNDYGASPPRDLPDRELLDPVLGWLGLAALIAGIAFLARGFRLYFVAWIVVSGAAAALLLANLAAWKLIGVVPAFTVLTALLVDDVRTFVARRFGSSGAGVLAALLVVATAFSFWSNADTLFRDLASGRSIQYGYAAETSRIYIYCHEQREAGDGTYGVSFINVSQLSGFSAPHETFEEGFDAWGDATWVCHDLDGVQLPAPEEAWPLRGLPDGPIMFGFSDPRVAVDTLVEQLNRAYPGLGQPDRISSGPGDAYAYVGYNLDGPGVLGPRGLYGTYSSYPLGPAAPVVHSIDALNDFSWDGVATPALPFLAEWHGLIYVPESGPRRLIIDSPDNTTATIDGQLAYRTAGPLEDVLPITLDLNQGWHVIEVAMNVGSNINAARDSGPSISLAWITPDGVAQPVVLDDLFPLADLHGWTHERVLGLVSERNMLVTQRVDFRPHESLPIVVERSAPPELVDVEAYVTEERWRGGWNIDQQGSYRLRVVFRSGTVALIIDGQEVASSHATIAPVALDANRSLAGGRHTIEIVQRFAAPPDIAGLTLELIEAPEGELDSLSDVMPY